MNLISRLKRPLLRAFMIFVLTSILCIFVVFILNYYLNRDLRKSIINTSLGFIFFIPTIAEYFNGPRLTPEASNLIVFNKAKNKEEMLTSVMIEGMIPFSDKKEIIPRESSIEYLEPYLQKKMYFKIEENNPTLAAKLSEIHFFNKKSLRFNCFNITVFKRNHIESNLIDDCLPFNLFWFDFIQDKYLFYLKDKKTDNAKIKLSLIKGIPQIFEYDKTHFSITISKSSLTGSIDSHFAEVIISRINF